MRFKRFTVTVALGFPVILAAALSSGNAAIAQVTPGINPNAETPSVEPDGLNFGTDGIDTGSIDDVTSGVGELTQGIEGNLEGVTEDIENVAGGITEDIEDVAGGLQEQAEQVVDSIGLDQIDPQVEEVTGIVGVVDETIGAVTDSIDGIIGTIDDQIAGLLDLFSVFGSPDINDILGNPEEILGVGNDGNDGDFQDGEVGSSGGSLMSGAEGALGLPDPKVIEENINQSGTSPTEEVLATMTGGEGSPVIKLDAKEIFDADLAEEVGRASALTQEGQAKLAQNVEVANQSLTTSQELAEDSESQDVSQNIMRNISVQQAASQATDTLLAIDAQLRQRDDALRNIVESDALRQLKRDRVSQRRMDASAYSFAITHGGLISLPNLSED